MAAVRTHEADELLDAAKTAALELTDARRERIIAALDAGGATDENAAISALLATHVPQPIRPPIPVDLFLPNQLVGATQVYPPYSGAAPWPEGVRPLPASKYVAATEAAHAIDGWLSASAYISGTGAIPAGAPHFSDVGEEAIGPLAQMQPPLPAGGYFPTPLLWHIIPVQINAHTLGVVTVDFQRRIEDPVVSLYPGAAGAPLDGYVAAFADLHLFALARNADYGHVTYNLVTAVATNQSTYTSPPEATGSLTSSITMDAGVDQVDVLMWLMVEVICEIDGAGYAAIDLAKPFSPAVYGVNRYWGNQINIPSIELKLYQ
jgi:hypothetical protein